MSLSNSKISASILAANHSQLGRDILEAQDAGCDEFHFDVMDGYFTPEISMGPIILNSIRDIIKIPIEVHLMVKKPTRFIDAFSKIGVDFITFHIESDDNVKLTSELIRKKNISVGLAKNPSTPIEEMYPYVNFLDRVLIMCVDPGFSGQKFGYENLDSIRSINNYIQGLNLGSIVDLSVDGGVNSQTIIKCKEAGAKTFVSGSSIFWSGDIKSNLKKIRNNKNYDN